MEKSRREFIKNSLEILVSAILGSGSYLVGCDNKNVSANLIREDYNAKQKEGASSQQKYPGFNYPNEISQILKHARRVGVKPELLMAVRSAENGREGLAYGIIPQGIAKQKYERDKGYTLDNKFYQYESEREKQLCWAAWTIKKNKDRFNSNSESYPDFISYLASKYAPLDADNDSEGLNKNWERNVRSYYNKFNYSSEYSH